jgi:voltage-gated potassium channel
MDQENDSNGRPATSLIRLPTSGPRPPGRALAPHRVALGLVVFVALLAYVDRDAYRDAAGNAVSLLDCFYYATVSITTTGYGDIIPVTDQSRLVTTLLITPARILFLIILVGTTLEVLAARTRHIYRERIWRNGLKDHTIVCGYGTKGRAAIRTICARGEDKDAIVVVDPSASAVEAASRAGFAAVHGNATSSEVLLAAGITQAKAVIVAPASDDTAVLMTLTAREHNPTASIVAAVREEENAHLLRQSGAGAVIVTSAASGRLLGHATTARRSSRCSRTCSRSARGSTSSSARSDRIRSARCATRAADAPILGGPPRRRGPALRRPARAGPHGGRPGGLPVLEPLSGPGANAVGWRW